MTENQLYDIKNVGFTVEASSNMHPDWADCGEVFDTEQEAQEYINDLHYRVALSIGDEFDGAGFKTRIVAPVFH